MKQKQVLEIIYEGKKIHVRRSWLRWIKQRIFRTNRQHKDRLFIRLFSDPKAMLELYNAINNSHYTNPDDLTITTMEDAVYLGMKNDCSFLIGNYLNLYEHQSTFNPNMPLRGFLYFAGAIQGYLAMNHADLYSSTLVKIPTPRYIVFYNGNSDYPDSSELHLSDAFETDDGCMEFTAHMLNINLGHNLKLMEHCRLLEEYAIFIDKIRWYQAQGYITEEAIDAACIYCIDNDILKDFLLKNRNEVRQLILTEYDEKRHLKNVREEGRLEGKIEGKSEEKILVLDLINCLIQDGQEPDILRLKNDDEYYNKMLRKYNLDHKNNM